ncbi:MAG: hypothetical protein ACFFCQ_03615 [Promethearchaeota archaeon]
MAREGISGVSVWCSREGIHTAVCPLDCEFNCETCMEERNKSDSISNSPYAY